MKVAVEDGTHQTQISSHRGLEGQKVEDAGLGGEVDVVYAVIPIDYLLGELSVPCLESPEDLLELLPDEPPLSQQTAFRRIELFVEVDANQGRTLSPAAARAGMISLGLSARELWWK